MIKMTAWLVLGLALVSGQLYVANGDSVQKAESTTSKYSPEILLGQIIGLNLTSPRRGGYGFDTGPQFFPDSLTDQQFDPGTQSYPLNDNDYGSQIHNGANNYAGSQNNLETQNYPGIQNNPGIQNYADAQIDPGTQNPQKPKKRRRRRRKPKAGVNQYGLYPGTPVNIQPGQTPLNYGYQPGFPVETPANLGPAPINYGYQPGAPVGNMQVYGPNYGRPPRTRVREGAISAVSNALGSIAKYDDYQCVPRLLCEVASGRDVGFGGAGSGAGAAGGAVGALLPAFLNLQPLITLLAANNGMTSSPLFVFGRAALLGMTSQGNPASCRYAYPLCPNDPDKLLDYLNNHNGGFFRFFSGTPDVQQNYGSIGQPNPGQYGLQQFYNHLANIPLNQYDQGALSPQNQYSQIQQTNVPFNQYNKFGLLAQNQNYPNGQQSYGIYNEGPQNVQTNTQQNYGVYKGLSQKGNYGHNYKYDKKIRFKNSILGEDVKDNKIEKRIQNSPVKFVNSEMGNGQYDSFGNNYNLNGNLAWSFPEGQSQINEPLLTNDIRTGNFLKFPQISETTTMKTQRFAKGFAFPGSQSNRNYIEYYNYPPIITPQDFPLKTGTGDLKFDSSNQDFVSFGQGGPQFDQEGEYYADYADGEVIYILRGDGDPNNPEVVKLRPGQNIVQ